MTTDLRCYGDDIQGLADLVPDFDLRSAMDVESWYPREWQAIADTLGFAQQLAAAPRAMPTTPDRITAMTLVGLMAFEHALRAGRPGVPESQARVQSAVIQAMTARDGRCACHRRSPRSAACTHDAHPRGLAFRPATR